MYPCAWRRVVVCVRTACSPVNSSECRLPSFHFALLIRCQLSTVKCPTSPRLSFPGPTGPLDFRLPAGTQCLRVSASSSERLMNHRIYDWPRRSLLRGQCGGQAPSNTKQAELMGILWRKRAGRMERESCVYIGEECLVDVLRSRDVRQSQHRSSRERIIEIIISPFYPFIIFLSS